MQPPKLLFCIWRDSIKPSLRFSWYCVFFVSKGNSFWFLFYSTVAGVVPCGGRKKSPPDHWAHPGYFENRMPLKPALGGVCNLANYSFAYEETQSNRVSDFYDIVCSLFPKAILFDFYLLFLVRTIDSNRSFSQKSKHYDKQCRSWLTGHYEPLIRIYTVCKKV